MCEPAGSRIADTHTPSSEFGDLYDRHINHLPRAGRPSAAYVDIIRSRQLFKVIVQQNRALFENARVLELPSGDGRWGLAALDAGAAHVTCVEPLPRVAGPRRDERSPMHLRDHTRSSTPTFSRRLHVSSRTRSTS